jgi:hypothetical protein
VWCCRRREGQTFRIAFNSSERVKESGGRFGTGITGLALVFLAIFPSSARSWWDADEFFYYPTKVAS